MNLGNLALLFRTLVDAYKGYREVKGEQPPPAEVVRNPRQPTTEERRGKPENNDG